MIRAAGARWISRTSADAGRLHVAGPSPRRAPRLWCALRLFASGGGRDLGMLWQARATTLTLAGGLVFAQCCAVLAQERPAVAPALAAQPVQPEQVAELDALFQAQVAEQGDAAYAPQNVIDLSRLLASPCDQVLWVGRQIAALTPTPAAARQLAELAAQRAAALGGLLSGCQDQWAACQPMPPSG